MKIGFSFGQCIADLVNKKVKFDDVLLIISGTAIEKREDIDAVIESYASRPGYLLGLDYAECLDMAQRIWDNHKLYQPRLTGDFRSVVPRDCIWGDLLPSPVKGNAALEQAWDQYRMLVSLTGDVPENVQDHWRGGIF